MTRQRILLAMVAIGVVLSLTGSLQAGTSIVFSHTNSSVGIGIAARIGGPIVAPGRYPPGYHRHVVIEPPRRRFVRIGPPVVVHRPVVEVLPPPVVYEPAPPVIIRTPAPMEATAITVWITNSNGSRTSVQLTRDGAWYVGPRGEYYAEMPTNEQLRVVYGF